VSSNFLLFLKRFDYIWISLEKYDFPYPYICALMDYSGLVLHYALFFH